MSFAQLRSRPIYNVINAATTAAPSVTSDGPTAVTATTAVGNGTVTSDNGSAITERGVVWALTVNPTTSDTKVTAAGTTGSYAATMTGLPPYTTIHYRAYAINAVGTSYGSDVSFLTTSQPRQPFVNVGPLGLL